MDCDNTRGNRTYGRSYLICSLTISILLFALFSTKKISHETLVKRTLANILKKERPSGHTLTPAEARAYRERAAAIVDTAPSATVEKEVNPFGIIGAIAVLLQGAAIAFVGDFWAEYEQFRQKEADWAGYVEYGEKPQGTGLL